MISIIICSVNKNALKKAMNNVSATIGVPFETIAIDNRNNSCGICEAYNTGALRAKYDILCFMHEDVSFDTENWGQKVIDHLFNSSIGLIGLAGGDTKSYVPSSWASLISASEISYVQHFKNPAIEPQKIYRTSSPENKSSIKQVACIDGFWMCTRKDVFAKYRFDSKTFKGFHGYDIDFSLRVGTEYKVAVIFDVIVHHYSEGSFDKTWMKNAILLSNKWKNKLPVTVCNLDKKELIRQHWTAMNCFIDKLIELNYPLPAVLFYFFKYSFHKLFYWKHFLHFLKYIFIAHFKMKRGTLTQTLPLAKHA